MNKFLKGAVACAAIVPCLTGLVGCGDKKTEVTYTAENAYNDIMVGVNNITTKMAEIETPGKEFQLNVNVTINYQALIGGLASADASVTAKLRAVIGARHQEGNKEVFGNIGMVDTEDNFTSLLSAYAIDDVDTFADKDADEEFELIGKIASEDWETVKGLVYIKDGDDYVLAGDVLDAEADYYMCSKDLLHIYLNSDFSALREYTLLTEEPADWAAGYGNYYRKDEKYTLKSASDVYEANKYYIILEGENYQLVTDATAPVGWETGEYYVKDVDYVEVTDETAPTFKENTYYEQTGLDVNTLLDEMTDGLVQIPEGKVYATLDMGTPVSDGEGEGEDSTEGDEGSMDIASMLDDIKNMDYNTFIENMGVTEGVSITGNKGDNGDVVLTMASEVSTIKFCLKADGDLTISIDPIAGGDNSPKLSVVIDISLEDEVEDKYIPTNLADYGESRGDLIDLIGEMSGGSEE